jgi:hypothetical protein
MSCGAVVWKTLMLYCSFVLSAFVLMFQVMFMSTVSYLHFFNPRHLVKNDFGIDTVIWCGSFLVTH